MSDVWCLVSGCVQGVIQLVDAVVDVTMIMGMGKGTKRHVRPYLYLSTLKVPAISYVRM